MADLHILIKKSAVTGTLSGLADKEEELVYIRIPTANRTTASIHMRSINDDNWMSSDTVVDLEGFQTVDIRVPKKAITG